MCQGDQIVPSTILSSRFAWSHKQLQMWPLFRQQFKDFWQAEGNKATRPLLSSLRVHKAAIGSSAKLSPGDVKKSTDMRRQHSSSVQAPNKFGHKKGKKIFPRMNLFRLQLGATWSSPRATSKNPLIWGANIALQLRRQTNLVTKMDQKIIFKEWFNTGCNCELISSPQATSKNPRIWAANFQTTFKNRLIWRHLCQVSNVQERPLHLREWT